MFALKDAWWNDLGKLREKVDAIYQNRGINIWEISAEKMIPLRKWVCNKEKLVPILEELGVYYVPKNQPPGPLFCFPETDAEGRITRAQTKPLSNEYWPCDRYHTLGVKAEHFLGPVWLGNQEATLANILRTKFVVVVEGPFDLIAARLVAPPGIPILSSLTKSMGPKHIDYLKILGVNCVYLLYDNDAPGVSAAKWLVKNCPIHCERLICPESDPSRCLEKPLLAKSLSRVLNLE